MPLTVLQKGYFWQGVGLLLILGPLPLPAFIESLNKPNGDLRGEFGVLYLLTSWFGFGLYLVGAAHISISPASLRHKLLAIWLPLLAVVGGWMTLVYVLGSTPPVQSSADDWALPPGSYYSLPSTTSEMPYP